VRPEGREAGLVRPEGREAGSVRPEGRGADPVLLRMSGRLCAVGSCW
jgi:hypothetical protein